MDTFISGGGREKRKKEKKRKERITTSSDSDSSNDTNIQVYWRLLQKQLALAQTERQPALAETERQSSLTKIGRYSDKLQQYSATKKDVPTHFQRSKIHRPIQKTPFIKNSLPITTILPTLSTNPHDDDDYIYHESIIKPKTLTNDLEDLSELINDPSPIPDKLFKQFVREILKNDFIEPYYDLEGDSIDTLLREKLMKLLTHRLDLIIEHIGEYHSDDSHCIYANNKHDDHYYANKDYVECKKILTILYGNNFIKHPFKVAYDNYDSIRTYTYYQKYFPLANIEELLEMFSEYNTDFARIVRDYRTIINSKEANVSVLQNQLTNIQQINPSIQDLKNSGLKLSDYATPIISEQRIPIDNIEDHTDTIRHYKDAQIKTIIEESPNTLIRDVKISALQKEIELYTAELDTPLEDL
jgi:hypothetical protein